MIIKPKRSLWLLWLLIFFHVGALACIWLANLAWWISFVLSFLVSAHFYYVYRRHYLRNLASSIVALDITKERSRLTFHDNSVHTAFLLADSVVTRYFMTLNFLQEGSTKRHSLLLVRDSASKEVLSQLRVLLWTGAVVQPDKL